MVTTRGNKQALRLEFLKLRETLAPDQIHQLSLEVQQRVLTLADFQQAESVALYYPFRSEVETLEILAMAISQGKKVFFPKVSGQALHYIKVTQPFSFQPGPWGLSEPPENEEAPLSHLDLIIIPGVAFDHQGYRIGFGKGYYDRSLKEFHGCRVGLAYDFQIVPQVPTEPGDLYCHYVVSENHTLGRFHHD